MGFLDNTYRLKFIDGKALPFITKIWDAFIEKIQLYYVKKYSYYKLKECGNKKKDKIVVSLTTYPARNKTVEVAIKSLLMQSLVPDKIVIWIASEQYEKIPEQLNCYKKYGVEFRFCDDLKSHKKYYYAMKEQGESLLITVDDDLIYPEHLIEDLYQLHLKYPTSIICYRGREIKMCSNGKIKNYERWPVVSKEGTVKPSYKIMPSTGAGVLYPPRSVSTHIFNQEQLKQYAFLADDIWVKFMSLLQGTKVIKTHKNCRYLTGISQDKGLMQYNVANGGNNKTIRALEMEYIDAVKQLMK